LEKLMTTLKTAEILMNKATKAQVTSRILPAALCALGLLASFTASADDANNVTNPNPLGVGAAQVSLITMVISVPAGQVRELAITHSFECAVGGLGFTSWLEADIYVDGVIVSPTSSDNASCATNNTAGQDGWVNASQTVVRAVGGGLHTVQVRGRVVGAGNARVDDQSLTVIEEIPV
jgi:hypothetical protein